MTYYNQNHDSISTVQLSPFVEEQWHRIDTYSPIYPHWADILIKTQQRTNRPTSGKLNLNDQIDLNTLKLDDEILLHELYDLRKGSALLSRAKNRIHELRVNNEQEDQTASLTDNYQGSSDCFPEAKIPLKDGCNLTETSLTYEQSNKNRPVSSNQTIPSQVKKFPRISFGPKPQPSLLVQLRQSAIIRQNALLASNDQRIPTPRSISTPKRSVSSAHSSRHYQQQPQSPFRHDVNSLGSFDDQLSLESLLPVTRPRTRSAHSSRSTIYLLKTKTDRIRQKQNIGLKTVLVRPWRQASWNDEILDDTIPNSFDIMHKICGPATPFEHNLRNNYRKQLSLFRNSSMKS